MYGATSAKLFGICLRITGDREAAEDALQETYLKVWRRADRFDATRASAVTWLALLARGTAIDVARARGRTFAGLDVLAQNDMPSGGDPDFETRATLTNCLDQLEASQREPIRSAFFDGYSYAELAAHSAVPLPTMKSRIRRGLLALRRCLDDA